MRGTIQHMKQKLLIAVGAFAVGIVSAGGQSRTLMEGSQPYTPTRLEWLELQLNSVFRIPVTESLYGLDFAAIPSEDVIEIHILFDPSVDRRIINLEMEQAKRLVATLSRSRGWDSWLKVKELVEMKSVK